MEATNYYVAMPFTRTGNGDLVAGAAKEYQTAGAAVREAQKMAAIAAGAVAFYHSGHPTSGDYDDAVIIHRFGERLSLSQLLSPQPRCPAFKELLAQKAATR